MPDDLTGDAAELWRAVVPRLLKAGLLIAEDAPALRDMCVCWQRLQECEREIARDGPVVEGYRGSKVKHPAVAVARSYRESLQKYFQKFGLEPMDRQRLPEPEEPAAENSILQLLQRNRDSSRNDTDGADLRKVLER
jgi:P27 family predicted phage terminase small subunit